MKLEIVRGDGSLLYEYKVYRTVCLFNPCIRVMGKNSQIKKYKYLKFMQAANCNPRLLRG